MSRLIVSMNLSLDGYVGPPGEDDGSWLRIDEEVHQAFNVLAKSADAFLYGRKVYEFMPSYWPDAIDDAARPDYEREYGRLWIEKPKVVFSTSLEETRWNTRVVRAGILEEVARLKRESQGYLLCYGGPQVASALQQQGLVDEYALFVHPTALGAGLPFFRGRVNLELADVRRFKMGAIELRYSTGLEA